MTNTTTTTTTRKRKYVTLKNGDGCDFRKIAKIMTDAGYKMNHATARNQLMLAIKTVLLNASSSLNIKLGKNHIQEMVSNQALQDNLADVLCLAYYNLKQEEKEEERLDNNGKIITKKA